eukprot:UN05575
MTSFKETYVEVYGSPAKNWEKVSRREIYYGDLCWETKKLCKSQIWFLVKKHEVGTIFVFENQRPMTYYF